MTGFSSLTQAECDIRAASGADTRVWVRQIMGMPISVHVQATCRAAGNGEREEKNGQALLAHPLVDQAVASVYQELTWWDSTFSLWKTHSELSRLRDGHISKAQTCPEMQAVMDWCEAAYTATGGLFDAQLPAADRHQPTNVPVPGARRPVEVRFDPTGLVKGLAVEHAIAHLAHLPGIAVVVNAGGDLLTACGKYDEHTPSDWPVDQHEGLTAPTWNVGVSDPHHEGTIAAVIRVPGDGMAVATSGGAVRGAHIFDPLNNDWVDPSGSVTVIGPSLTWADVWATALCAGPATALEQLTVWNEDYSGFRL